MKYKCSNGHHWDSDTGSQPQYQIIVTFNADNIPIEVCGICVMEFLIAKFGHVTEDQ